MSKLISDLTSPLSRTRKRILSLLSPISQRLTERQRFWIGFTILGLSITLLINNPLLKSETQSYKVGEIARETIVSPANINLPDEEGTRLLREAAKEAVLPVFRIEASRGEKASQNFTTLTERLKRGGSSGSASDKQEDVSVRLGLIKSALALRNLGPNEIEALRIALKETADGYIYEESERNFFADSKVTLTDTTKPGQNSTEALPATNWTSIDEAKSRFRERLSAIKSLSSAEADAWFAALAGLIEPTVSYDAAGTEAAKRTAEAAVPQEVISLERNQTVVREGDKVTAEAVAKISAIRDYGQPGRKANLFLGLLAIISGLLWVAWKFVQHNKSSPRNNLSPERTFALLGFVIVIQTALMSVLFRLAEYTAVQNIKAPFNDSGIWAFVIPFAFGGLTLTLLSDRRTALLAGLILSFIAGLLAPTPKPLYFALYSMMGSAVAVYGIGHYRTRQSVTVAGFFIGLASIASALALIGYSQQPFVLSTVLLAIACGLVNGIITAGVTAVFLPICESLFGILTDVKLLELSNADLPVLGQLALRAPGTNQHSHAVGQIAEEACRAVGANGLLARIGALYHDIGKVAAPDHFIENQAGTNPHDRLTPAQSAKIIVSHVTFGIKMGREIGLPSKIIDFIPQHHGTRTLHYFLRKAEAEAEAKGGGPIDENEFRYPGPKPQFKETAIMMIADSCEAAARALEEPTPDNVRYIVTKIIDAILADDQLNECDLTLKELAAIREAIIKSLCAMYHPRVDYPGFTLQDEGESGGASDEKSQKFRDPKDLPISKGGEIEDEAYNITQEPNRN